MNTKKIKMKKLINSCKYAIYVTIALQIAFQTTPLFSKPLNDTHIRNGVWGEVPNQYMFKNIPDNVGFITEFPLEHLKNKVGIENLNNYQIDYWIHTSVEDAELTMVERLDMSNLLMNNIIESPLHQGPIGDNCWHQLSAGIIRFLRNNVYVSISNKTTDPDFDANKIVTLARTINSLIVVSDKVDDANLIPAPTIHSIDILSSLPDNWEKTVDVLVNASDPNNQKLFYRKYATGFGIVSETGNLQISFNKNTDKKNDSANARVKIWIWNEDNIVASAELDIPF